MRKAHGSNTWGTRSPRNGGQQASEASANAPTQGLGWPFTVIPTQTREPSAGA